MTPLIGSAHLAQLPGSDAAALDVARRLVVEGRRRGAELVVLPQRLFDRPQASDGDVPRGLAAIAVAAGAAVLCGYLERCSGRLHDATLLIGPNGTALANYRRAHLDAGDEALSPGQWLTLMPVIGRRLGLSLGCDLRFPEVARALVLAGADLLAVQTGNDPAGALLAKARAVENGVPVALATAGAEAADAMLLAPDGAVLARARDGVAVAAVPPLVGPTGRRPRLYMRLVEPEPGDR